MQEFWRRLEVRHVEPDLAAALRLRAARSTGSVQRLGAEATVIAVVERILPGSDIPASVLAKFLDDNFDKQMGRGDERDGLLPRADLLPVGFVVLDSDADGSFARRDRESQEALLRAAEHGELKGPSGFESSLWFSRLRDLLLLGFGADPRGMVQMGYPGPSYKPGYVWLRWSGVEARLKRRPGYMEL
jgi:plasmid stability protein